MRQNGMSVEASMCARGVLESFAELPDKLKRALRAADTAVDLMPCGDIRIVLQAEG